MHKISSREQSVGQVVSLLQTTDMATCSSCESNYFKIIATFYGDNSRALDYLISHGVISSGSSRIPCPKCGTFLSFQVYSARQHHLLGFWPAYRQLSELGNGHYTVNHKKHFVKPGEPEVNTQKVERLWRDIKEWVKRPGIRSRYLQQYLARYLFVTAVPELQQLHRFFIEASKLYPPFSEVVRRQPEPEVVSEDEAAVA
ncbi:hypothetical protein ElyMa_002193800 [Elysia marginata]|uniref:ISXO2-like transposase domain-containing protein n=1 Tax=Elysia marginata TaxID=1093978 RepID=A0AAV4FSK1_9GAST|nr:hypothetical protein ElyMa_002193800 [Elysia marginata]